MDPAIAKELAALHAEIESASRGGARRASGRDLAPAVDSDAGDQEGGPAAWAEQLKELIAAMQGAVETTGSSVSVHPIAGVAAAFVAGVLIGRLTKIG